MLRAFCSRRAFIYFLEAWAQIVTVFVFADLLHGPYTAFIDNEAAKHALIKGYGKDHALNSLIGTFWCTQTCLSADPWFVRVSSEANLSDAVSRGDFSQARELQWVHIELDYMPAYQVTLRIAQDEVYAHTQACSDLYQCLAVAARPQLLHLGLLQDSFTPFRCIQTRITVPH